MKSRIFLGFTVIVLIGLSGYVSDLLAQEVSAVIFLEKSQDSESGVEEINGEFRVPRNRLVKILVAVSTQAAININIEIEATSGGNSAQLDLACTGNGSQASCSGLSVATDTTFEVSFSASQLVEKLTLGQAEQTVTLTVSVLGVVGAQVAPVSGGDRELSLTLDEAVVDLGLEGPVILTPVLPQQGDIATLSFFVRNNDLVNTGALSALDFNLQRPDGSIIDMTLLVVECVIETFACTQGGTVPANDRKQVTVQFVTSTLVPTEGNQAYRILIGLASARDDVLDNNAFAVNFALGAPVRDFSVAVQSPAPGFEINPEQEVVVRFTVLNNTPLLLSDNVVVFDLKIQTPTEDPEVFQFVELPSQPPVFRCGLPEVVVSSASLEVPESAAEQSCIFNANPSQLHEFEVRFDGQSLGSGTYQFTVQIAQKVKNDLEPENEIILVTDSTAQIPFEVLAPVIVPEGIKGQGIAPVRGPELRPIEFKFVPSTTAGQGAKVLLSTTIKNSGNREARDIVVSFSIKREGSLDPFVRIGVIQRFPRLGVGLSLKVNQILDVDGLDLEPGVYRIRVSVTVNDANTQELDPQNNALEGLITVNADDEI